MDIQFLIMLVMVIGFLVLGWLVRYWIIQTSTSSESKTLLEWLKSTNSNIQETSQSINQSLSLNSQHLHQTLHSNTQSLNQRLDNTAKYMTALSQQIGEISEIGRSMKDLQDFLKSPKLRGNIGEEVLNDLISQIFPKNTFNLQYSFRSGEKVDAALKTDAGILPIDSKFPMENFRKYISSESEKIQQEAKKLFYKDVKKHINDIAQKYILPDEGTVDFAIMYLPSEAIYYDVVNAPDLVDYARNKRVYIVSPSTLYALLQTILLSFEGKSIAEKSKQIFQLLRAIQSDYQKTSEHLTVLGRHLNNAYSKLNEVNQAYGQIGQKLDQTKLLDK